MGRSLFRVVTVDLHERLFILSPVLVTATGFGLVIGFINHSQIVTTINYNIVPDFYTTKHSTLIFSVYLHSSSLSVSWRWISTWTHTSNITAPSLT
jgi:hypothetical protein